jgi:hypothetical protein
MDVDTLKKYMKAVGADVEERFKKALGDKPFGLMADMWDKGHGEKMLGVFVVTEKDMIVPRPQEIGAVVNQQKNECSYSLFFLCFTPTFDPKTSDGNSQIETIRIALENLGVVPEDSKFFTADNTNVNPSIARKLDIPFIGCKSHILALSAKELLAPYRRTKAEIAEGADLKLLDKVNALMVKLEKSTYHGLLVEAGCDLVPKKYGHKWDSVHEMVTRYKAMRNTIWTISRLNAGRELREYVLNEEEDEELDSLYDTVLTPLHAATIALQVKGTNLADAEVVFENFGSKFEVAPLHIRTDGDWPKDKLFESGILKLLKGLEGTLTPREADRIRRLKKPVAVVDDPDDNEEELNQTQQLLRQLHAAKLARTTPVSAYIGVAWLPATTDDIERVFSLCKRVWSEQRKAMTPETFEIIVYMSMNRRYWNINDVANVVRAKNW